MIIGSVLTSRREILQRKLDFLEKQLDMFYSPMLGIRNEIKVQSEIRSRLQTLANEEWLKIVNKIEHLDIEKKKEIFERRSKDSEKLIEYDTSKLREKLIPAYRRMSDLFRENYWLAEEETREYFVGLLEYVEIWNRWIEGTLPVEVLMRLDHAEENLDHFYLHIEKMHNSIRYKVKTGDPRR